MDMLPNSFGKATFYPVWSAKLIRNNEHIAKGGPPGLIELVRRKDPLHTLVSVFAFDEEVEVRILPVEVDVAALRSIEN